jgi:CubicO group peptidase (beta-lactamase class C family)
LNQSGSYGNWRLGYHRIITMGKRAKNGFGHIGYNGSGAWCDPERDLSFAYRKAS